MKRTDEQPEITRDIRYVSDAIINLFAGHINSLLYPYDHPLVSDSLKNAFNCLQKAFRKKKTVHIDTSAGRVFVDGEALESDIPVIRHFASWMNGFQIKSLSLSDDLSRRELISFHKIMSAQKRSGESLVKIMAEKFITNITVQMTDVTESGTTETALTGTMSEEEFRRNFLSTMFSSDSPATEVPDDVSSLRAVLIGNAPDEYAGREVEITLTPIESAGNESPGALYSDHPAEELRHTKYIETLLERDVSEETKREIRNIPPAQMAHILNATLFGTPSDTVLARLAEAYFGGEIGEDPDRTVQRRRAFFRGLKPDIGPHLLRHCESRFSVDGLLDDVGSMEIQRRPAHEYAFPPDTGHQYESPPDTDHGHAAPPETADGRAARPAQTPYEPVRKLENTDFTFDIVVSGKAVIHDIEFDDTTAALFDNSRLAGFKDGASLDALLPQFIPLADGSGTVAGFLEECTDDAIQNISFDAILDLLNSDSLDGEACQKMTGRLVNLVEVFADRGELEKVLDIFNALKTHSLQGAHGLHATVISRSIFSTDQFNAKLVEALRRHGRKQRETAGKITGALRSYLVPYLLDALSEEPETSKRRFMIMLLTSVSADVLPHIALRFRDSRWYVLRNLLYLLRECHGLSYAKYVKEFLDHEVPLVRLEALRTLLSFQDPSAERHVLTFLRSDVFQLQKGAVWLAGTYRIRSAVSPLILLMKEKDILGKKFHLKKMIVRSLGRIGDGHALSYLLHLFRSTSMVHKDEYDKLKLDMYRTLHNYPMNMLGPLIDHGTQSPNSEIVSISRKLAEHYSQSVGRKR